MASRPGWHRGEDSIHAKLGYDKLEHGAGLYKWIKLELPHDQAQFHSSKVQYLPMCILDEDNRPWVSILSGRDGQTGYIHYPEHNTLEVEATLWEGDPFSEYFKVSDPGNTSSLFAAVGIDVSTRTRNKFAGKILKAYLDEELLKLKLEATQAISNCPKYIAIRELRPHSNTNCVVQEQKLHIAAGERLPQVIVDFILEADSSILGTVYEASLQEATMHPSHLGANHRGGKPGFLRVKPSDGRTIVLPDYSGDRIMTSLGNIEVTPVAALTIISFHTGDVLYITGKARNVHGADARAIMPLQSLLTEIYVTGYTFVRDAFPARQNFAVQPQPSPYNPPLKYLAEEETHSTIFSGEQLKARLTRIIFHSPTIATFEWESSVNLRVDPGQAIILDLRPWLGTREFRHIWDEKPSLVNDDFIRTWTVSSHTPAESGDRRFSVTLRKKEGGTVTEPLFQAAMEVTSGSERAVPFLNVDIVGICGTFVLPSSADTFTSSVTRLLWIAGGIGVTPFLPMLAAISKGSKYPTYDITLLISTREPDVILKLLCEALNGSEIPHWLSVHIFSNASSPKASGPATAVWPHVEWHTGRLGLSFLEVHKNLLSSSDLQIFVCGPDSFADTIIASLGTCGVDVGRIHREGFSY